MRLIDADALKTMLYSYGILYPLHGKLIDACETIDPVKHGHWVENPIGCSCSVCGEVHRYDVLTANMTHLYCNHCGSRMDEVSE